MSLFLFVSISCFYTYAIEIDDGGYIKIPVDVYFNSEEDRDLYEEKIILSIEEINKIYQYANVQFYLQNTIINNDFDMVFAKTDKQFSDYLDITSEYSFSFPVFAVNEITIDKQKFSGYALSKNYCEKFVVFNKTNEKKLLFAHEFGHLTGLEHVGDKDNIMYAYHIKNDSYFTNDQLETVEETALHIFTECMN